MIVIMKRSSRLPYKVVTISGQTRVRPLNTYRGASWTGVPTASVGSNECRGAITTSAGNGTAGFLGDGGAATAAKQSKTRAARVDKCAPQILEGKGLDD